MAVEIDDRLLFSFAVKELIGSRPFLIDIYEQVYEFINDGKTGNVLNINMPPRLGKSFLATSLSAYMLWKNPKLRMLRVCYSAVLAEQFALQTRMKYESLFEELGLRMPEITGNRARWMIEGSKEYNLVACGVNGGVTGFGFDLAVVDDTAKSMADACSPAWDRMLRTFKQSVLIGRMEGMKKIINVGTRWTTSDWFSLFEPDAIISVPALKDGKSICQDWRTTEELEMIRMNVGEAVWSAQYMQSPTVQGRVALLADMPLHISEESRHANNPKVCVIDPATEYGKDMFVMGIYSAVKGDTQSWICWKLYGDSSLTVTAAVAKLKKWFDMSEFDYVLIESNGVGSSISKRIKEAGVPCRCFATRKDKYTRVYSVLDRWSRISFENGAMSADLKIELLSQMRNFPNVNVHDDLVDNVTMALEHIV